MCERSKGVTTPGVKQTATESSTPPPSPLLSGEEASLYRSMAMRAAYLSADRSDIQFATKELAREMGSPTADSLGRLKRLVRCLLHRPRVCAVFNRQRATRSIDGYSDSD